MSTISKEYNIKARDFIHAGESSIDLKKSLKALNLDQEIIRRAAVCAYESEMNIVMHGGDGILILNVDETGIIIEARDDGQGISDIDLALQEGYSTATDEYREMGFGAGMGLPNIKKNSDFLDILSIKGKGTCLTICFWLS